MHTHLYYTCRSVEKLDLWLARKENLLLALRLTVFTQQGKTQIASDPIYITLHNFMITVRQRSSRPQLFRLFAARKDKMGNTPGKQLLTLLSKITRRGRWLVSASVRNIPISPILIQKLSLNFTRNQTMADTTMLGPFYNHRFQDWEYHPWLKSIHVTWFRIRHILFKCEIKMPPANLHSFSKDRVKHLEWQKIGTQ